MPHIIPFPVARYEFSLRVTTPIRQPDYAGSMLRGAFGGALRHAACMTRQKECTGCPLYRSCPYPAIFAPPQPEQQSLQLNQIPNPYIIEPPPWGAKIWQIGDIFRFNMVLIGPPLQQLPLIIYAWQRAFTRDVGHGTAELHAVHLETPQGKQQIWAHGQLTEHLAQLEIDSSPIANITLNLQTPLRLQENGRALPPNKLDETKLLMNLIRRTSQLSELHMEKPLQLNYSNLKFACQQVQGTKKLHWLDWTRYSSRQQQTMQLGGVVGQWQLSNLPAELGLLLRLGQWLHLGKNATFGLGQYLLEAEN